MTIWSKNQKKSLSPYMEMKYKTLCDLRTLTTKKYLQQLVSAHWEAALFCMFVGGLHQQLTLLDRNMNDTSLTA